MIRAQRAAHRRIFLGLAVALPPLLASASSDRPERPVVATTRLGSLAGEFEPQSSMTFVDRSEPFRALDLGVFDATESGGPSRISVRAPDDFAVPAALAYAATATASANGDSLPADARLLGAILPGRTTTFELRAGETTLVVYGLAWQEVLASGTVVESAR